jgi:hypothetical protein
VRGCGAAPLAGGMPLLGTAGRWSPESLLDGSSPGAGAAGLESAGAPEPWLASDSGAPSGASAGGGAWEPQALSRSTSSRERWFMRWTLQKPNRSVGLA